MVVKLFVGLRHNYQLQDHYKDCHCFQNGHYTGILGEIHLILSSNYSVLLQDNRRSYAARFFSASVITVSLQLSSYYSIYIQWRNNVERVCAACAEPPTEHSIACSLQSHRVNLVTGFAVVELCKLNKLIRGLSNLFKKFSNNKQLTIFFY